QLGLGVGEAGAVVDLFAVGVADHVVVEDHAAHAGELGAAGLQRVARLLHRLLGPLVDLGLGGLLAGVVKAAIGPVAVRREDGGQLAGLALGAVEVAADVVAGVAGEEDLFDGVALAVDLAVDDGLERGLRGEGPEPVANEDLLADVLAALLPRFLGGRGRPGE